ncbi:TIGR03086 family metal-binding protein [Nocardiopsis suaedae]|uniref:TIGR03086 family metal-binding protein n=1 Tax=Nocardiopsis suaedae TaxID=3018444 RepID=A0ABT4TQ03_9ACTN|nr:TIGR03086 family metal-binding protein [Nocardiopsis suaedae]MDA2806763.1 TIGR03086 family metal-binding protein [Nocardiopsis suaedae]
MIDLEGACARLADLVSEVSVADLDRPTPCADFTVADLLDHLDEVARGFTALAGGGAGGVGGAGGQGRAGLPRRLEALGRAWASPSAWRGATEAGGVELANEVWGRIALTEVVVHGWDLARAAGRGFDPPEAAVRACLEHVADFVPSAPVPELWGRPVAVAEDAPLLERAVAITGRDPGWRAP